MNTVCTGIGISLRMDIYSHTEDGHIYIYKYSHTRVGQNSHAGFVLGVLSKLSSGTEERSKWTNVGQGSSGGEAELEHGLGDVGAVALEALAGLRSLMEMPAGTTAGTAAAGRHSDER